MSRASKATKTVLDVRVPIYTPHSLRPKMGVYLFDEQDALIGTELPAGVLDNQDPQHPIYGVVDHELDLSKKYTIRVGPQNLAASCAGELKECLKKADAPTLDSSQGEWDDPQTKIRLIMTFPPVDEAKVVLWREYTCAATPTRQSVPATATRVHGIVQKLRNPGGSPAAFDPLSPATVRVHVVDLRPTLDNIGDAELESIRDQVLARMLGVEVQVLGTMSQSDIAGVSALLADLHRPTGNALRSYIYDKRLELAPYMGGLIPVVSRHQVDEVSTYEDGSFFSKWSSGTAADVFLEVWQNQDGEDRQLGNPDVVTTTLWKYDGTAYAMVTTDDPAGIVCRPPARRTVRTRGAGPYVPYVAPNFIGWADLRNINGLLTRRGTGLLQDGKTARPWAQTLYLKMAFDASLPLPNGALKYYRWSYQFEGDSGFTYMNAPVVHRYMEYNPTTGTIGLKPYKLGPQSYNNVPCLFEIPPANPPPLRPTRRTRSPPISRGGGSSSRIGTTMCSPALTVPPGRPRGEVGR